MKELRRVTYRRLFFEAFPEVWTFQVVTAVMLSLPVMLLSRLVNMVAGASGEALTSADMKQILFSWRSPLLLILGILITVLYIVIELFAQVYLAEDVLSGERASILRELKRAFGALRHFATPTGLLIFLYILVAVPLGGLGFSISLSRNLYIPHFIMDVIRTTPLYLLAYLAVVLALIWFGFRSIFSVHAVLLDGMTPAEGRAASVAMIKAHGKKFIAAMLKTSLVLFLVQAVSILLLDLLPGFFLEAMGEDLPKRYLVDFQQLADQNLGSAEMELAGKVIVYRICSAFYVLMNRYLADIITLISGAALMLRFTLCYREFSGELSKYALLENAGNGEKLLFPERPKKAKYRYKLLGVTLLTAGVAVFSLVVGFAFSYAVEKDHPTWIVAHRAGGNMASENSIEGLEMAIREGCYASEIDVQRTKDGYYVINHDSTFRRLTGVDRAPEEMTLEEIRALEIADTTGNGQKLPVVTLEEMLPVIKGKEKLFIELKGKTADEQMVDDVVRIVKEYDCVEDVALISLNYPVISYAETSYPEFETGTLFFIGIGQVSRLNCDLLIMEEETATSGRIEEIHKAGKQAFVWTVNTEQSMRTFLNSRVDGIITDEIELAKTVQHQLDDRTDLEVIRDWRTKATQ